MTSGQCNWTSSPSTLQGLSLCNVLHQGLPNSVLLVFALALHKGAGPYLGNPVLLCTSANEPLSSFYMKEKTQVNLYVGSNPVKPPCKNIKGGWLCGEVPAFIQTCLLAPNNSGCEAGRVGCWRGWSDMEWVWVKEVSGTQSLLELAYPNLKTRK
jgi:hypothetical protein